MFDEKVNKSIQEAVHNGIILGLKESANILSQFIDKKFTESIRKDELKSFMEAYIAERENEYNKI